MKRGSGSGKSANVVKVKLTPAEDKIVNDVVAELGMHKQEVVRRIFSWFADQDDLIQKTLLRVTPKSEPARIALAGIIHKIGDDLAGEASSSGGTNRAEFGAPEKMKDLDVPDSQEPSDGSRNQGGTKGSGRAGRR